MLIGMFMQLNRRRPIYCFEYTRFDVLVPGKIKWLENLPLSNCLCDFVLVPGKIKWLENFTFLLLLLFLVLVPGKIKWLENILKLEVNHGMF